MYQALSERIEILTEVKYKIRCLKFLQTIYSKTNLNFEFLCTTIEGCFLRVVLTGQPNAKLETKVYELDRSKPNMYIDQMHIMMTKGVDIVLLGSQDG